MVRRSGLRPNVFDEIEEAKIQGSVKTNSGHSDRIAPVQTLQAVGPFHFQNAIAEAVKFAFDVDPIFFTPCAILKNFFGNFRSFGKQ